MLLRAAAEFHIESSSLRGTLCSHSSELFQNRTLYRIILSRTSIVKIRLTFVRIEFFAALRATFDFDEPLIPGGFCSQFGVYLPPSSPEDLDVYSCLV